ncbi:MAG: GGDEF domain-containing protein [Gammaproteobacteria bacterium]|nr:GGDEF domain-containing protein [Gammaproteobacteria bacterium]
MVGLLITATMATTAAINGNLPLSLSLYLAAFSFLFGYTYQYFTGKTELCSIIIIYALFTLLTYLIYAGGVNNTGPLWIFMFAPCSLYIHGLQKGLRDIGVFLVVISTLLFYPENAWLSTEYSHEFKLRLIYSFLTITFLSAIYEYSRAKAFTNLVEISQKFEQQAKIDPLTKVSNRRDALSILNYEVDRSERENEVVSVALFDLDYFKTINDTFGHDAGDQVLIKVAGMLQSITRKQDTVARWGGEEFFLIFPRTNIKDAFIIAEKIRKLLSETLLDYKGTRFHVTTSIGISEIRAGDQIEKQINVADQRLYKAKAAGRNCIEPSYDVTPNIKANAH